MSWLKVIYLLKKYIDNSVFLLANIKLKDLEIQLEYREDVKLDEERNNIFSMKENIL